MSGGNIFRFIFDKQAIPEAWGADQRAIIFHLRMAIPIIIAMGLMIILLISQHIVISDQSAEIARLSHDRVMVGVQSEEGYFLNVESIPEETVKDWGVLWLTNYINYTGMSAKRNLSWCSNRMSKELKVKTDLFFSQKAKVAVDQNIEYRFTDVTYDLQPLTPESNKDSYAFSRNRGYTLTATGFYSRYSRGRLIGNTEKRSYTIAMTGTIPSQLNPVALEVSDIIDPDVKHEGN